MRWWWCVLAACDGGDPTPADDTDAPVDEVTYADVQHIFDRHCGSAGCHGVPEATTGLDLTPSASHALLVDVPSLGLPAMDRVEPGDPDNSYLIHKLNGTFEDVGGAGDLMPPGLLPLAANDIQVVVDWIEAGALDE